MHLGLNNRAYPKILYPDRSFDMYDLAADTAGCFSCLQLVQTKIFIIKMAINKPVCVFQLENAQV